MKTTDAHPSRPSADISSPSAAVAHFVELVTDGSVWKARPVTAQPSLTLVQWQVLQLPGGARHFSGWALENRDGRASSAIQTFDAASLRGITRSERVYQLQGPPGWHEDGDYVWRSWARINGQPEWVDVSAEVWAAHLEATRGAEQLRCAAAP